MIIKKYIFSDKEVNNIFDEFELLCYFKVKFNAEQWKRLLFYNINIIPNDFIDKIIYVYVINDKSSCSDCLIENGIVIFDGDIKFNNFIQMNNLYGTTSKKQNELISSLIEYKEQNDLIINSLVGENGWKSFSEIFNVLNNSGCRYVVLRKFETLPEYLLDDDKDIDILCDNKYLLQSILGAKKRSLGISGYYIIVKNEKIAIDIRYKGDNYFDTSWEENILNSRNLNNKNIYVMNQENQLFTIIYHILTQKQKLSNYYLEYLYTIFEKQYDVNDLLNLLIKYMNINLYKYKKPDDSSVYQNNKNIYILRKNIEKNKYKFMAYRLFNKLPLFIFPKKFINYIIETSNRV